MTSKLLVPCAPGDSISAFFARLGHPGGSADQFLLIAGTLLGKVSIYDSVLRCEVPVCSFSDDAVRGVFIDDSAVYVLVSDMMCKRYNFKTSMNSGGIVLDPNFDFFRIPKRTSHGQFKYLVQNGAQVLTVYPGMMTVFDILSTDQRMTPYRLMASDAGSLVSAAPLDFTAEYVLIVEYLEDRPNPVLKVVKLSDGALLGMVDATTLTGGERRDRNSIFGHLDVVGNSRSRVRLLAGRFFLDGFLLAFVTDHSKPELVLYDLPSGRVAVKFPRYWKKGVRILDLVEWTSTRSVPGTPGTGLAVLDDSGGVSLWRLDAPERPVRTGRCPGGVFSMDLRYRIQVLDEDRALVTCDVGVVGVELVGKI